MRPFLVALGLVLALGTIVFFVFFFRGTAVISAEPGTAKITFDGSSASGKGTFKVWPGTYDLVIEQDGYIPLKRTEKLGVGQKIELAIELVKIPAVEEAVQEDVTLVTSSSDKKSVLYLGSNRTTLYQETVGAKKALTPASFEDPLAFRMSPTQDIAVLKKQNGDIAVHDFKRYDLVAQEQFFFGRDVGAIDWMYPEGTKLLYSYAPGSGERSLIIADRTNTSLERVLNLIDAGITDPTIGVAPDGKTAVLISRPGNNFGEFNIYLFDLFTKKTTKLTTDGNKTDARFSPDGQRIIYTRFEQDPNGLNNQLISAIDKDGKNRKDFELRATLDQVDFIDTTTAVVAATEKDGDKFYRLNFATGEVVPYYHSALSDVHFTKIVIVGDTVYATGSADPKAKHGTLYKVELATDEYK